MDALLSTLGFFALTGLFVFLHMRREERPSSLSTVRMVTRPCPRCKHAVPSESTFCPGCGVPQQIYEVVSAPAAAANGADGSVRPHALVRADMCVGCGTCVAACPEPGAIALKGKIAVVDQALCQGHGQCVSACPVGAIALATGAAVHRVEVPELGPDFQSNVPGIYIVGELGGRGLIKNAINEGRIAVENITNELEAARQSGGPEVPGSANQLDSEPFEVIIVGAGPAGLSAGLEAHRAGLRYALLEQGTLADTVRKYPRHKLLFAEPISIPLYGELWIADSSKESLLQVWETIVSNTGLDVRTGHKVENIQRRDGLLYVTTPDAVFLARRVVLAMGRRGSPRRLGVPGEDLEKVVYDIAEMEDFRGKRVLVVGGGDSALESAVGLANQPGTTVALSYRGDSFAKAKERNRTRIDAAMKSGRVEVYLGSTIREVREDRVVLDLGGQVGILPNDDVVVRIGGDAPHRFLEKLGVRIVQKDLPVPADLARAG